MVKYSKAGLDEIFGALSDSGRRKMLERLAHAEASVSELAELLGVSLPATLKHLAVLQRAGLVTQAKDGRVRRCTLEAAPMQRASDWISRYRQFWDRQLDGLDKYLNETLKAPTPRRGSAEVCGQERLRRPKVEQDK